MKIFILSIISVICLGLTQCANSSTTASTTSKSTNPTRLVGGWYPVFFDSYDQHKINTIVNTIKENRVENIVVSYDKNTDLASKVIKAIKSQSDCVLTEKQQTLKDDSATYNHDVVVVTVYLKSDK